MSISMIGIDHSRASVDVRARFSFTKKNAVSAMERLKEDRDILGCIILSTCNRMEIWASVQEDWEGSLLSFLCREKGRKGGCGASVLSDQRPEIPDSGGGPDHYPGEGRTDSFQGCLLYGRCAGGAFSDGSDGGEEG